MKTVFEIYYIRWFLDDLRGDDLIGDLTPEKQAELLKTWGDQVVTIDHFQFILGLIEAGVEFSQKELLLLLKKSPIHTVAGAPVIALSVANLINDQAAAYELMEAKIPDYFAHYHYHLKQKDVDNIIKWLNGERLKKIDSSIKTVARVLKKHTFYWNNFPRLFFNQNPLEMEAPAFHRLVKLGLLIDGNFTLTYLRTHMSYEEITEHYEVTQLQWGQYLADCYHDYTVNGMEQLLKAALQQNQEALLPGIVSGDSRGAKELIPEIFKIDRALCFKLLKLLTEKTQKLGNTKLRETIIHYLKTYPEGVKIARKLFDSPKKNPRLTGVQLLIHYNKREDLPEFNKRVDTEPDDGIKGLMKQHLEDNESSPFNFWRDEV